MENGHGKPHVHLKEKKIDVDYNWKQAFNKFDELKTEYEKKNMLKK